MALSASVSTAEPRAHSIGPRKIQVMRFTAASADVSGTITAPGLSKVEDIIIGTLQLTAAPTFSGNVVTLAFADPAATVYGTAILIGR